MASSHQPISPRMSPSRGVMRSFHSTAENDGAYLGYLQVMTVAWGMRWGGGRERRCQRREKGEGKGA